MTTEAQKGFRRIVTNYVSLMSTLIIGIIYLPVLIQWVGFQAFGLISLVGATAGFAMIFLELTNQSMLRELGAAFHSDDKDHFFTTYNSAFVVSFFGALISGTIFLCLLLVIPLLNVPPEWITPARWLIGSQGLYIAIFILCSPCFSMYQVREEFVWYNVWHVLSRSTGLGSALFLGSWIGIENIPLAITRHGQLMSILLTIAYLVMVCIMLIRHRELIPNPRLIQRNAVNRVFGTFGWNSGVHIGFMIHERVSALLMNLAFGVIGNAVFEVAHRLVSYVRMTTNGFVIGLDAVSARLSSGTTTEKIKQLIYHSTRLQALIALPAGLTVFLYAHPLIELWIGKPLDNPEEQIPLTVTIAQILVIALTSRAISDGWRFILYGAGHVKKYAPLILAGGILNPIIGGILLFILPESIRINAPAISYAVIFTVVHFLILPAIGAKCIQVPFRDLFTPLIRPALATALCSPLLIAPSLIVEHWTLLKLAIVAFTFGSIFAIVSWMIVLTMDERIRIINAVRQKMIRRRIA